MDPVEEVDAKYARAVGVSVPVWIALTDAWQAERLAARLEKARAVLLGEADDDRT